MAAIPGIVNAVDTWRLTMAVGSAAISSRTTILIPTKFQRGTMSSKPFRRRKRVSPRPFLFPLSAWIAIGLLPTTADAGPIQQTNDRVIAIDAVDFDHQRNQVDHQWLAGTAAGSTGAGALEAAPDSGARIDSGITTGSPQLDFQVEFQRAGTYYVWVRGLGTNGGSDSVHLGINGKQPASAHHVSNFGASFGWSNLRADGGLAAIEVPAPGVHTLNVWMREDGFLLDKLVLTQDPAYAPTDAGPALTARAPDTVESGGQAYMQDSAGLLSIDAENFSRQLSSTEHQWSQRSVTGASGEAAVEALPNSNVRADSPAAGAPQLQFEIEFNRAGRHYLWVRGLGATGRDDSVYVGLDGQALSSGGTISNFGASLGWSNLEMTGVVATVDVPAAGRHTLNVWMREDGFLLDKLVITPDPAFTPSGSGPGASLQQGTTEGEQRPAIQQQADGTVAVDATDFDASHGAGDHQWLAGTAAGSTGAGALEAAPDSGARIDSGITTGSPQLDFQVEFQRAGTYYVWVRGLGTNGGSDSVHLGINGKQPASAHHVSNFGASFGWSNLRADGGLAAIEVPAPGVHTLNVWMREDGFLLDKLVLTQDATFAPAGSGPALSPREASGEDGDSSAPAPGEADGGETPTDTSPSAAPDHAGTTEGKPVTIAVLANDGGLENAPVTVQVSQAPDHGTVRVETDERVTYTPDATFSGADSFMYTVTDADGDRAMANVTIDVTCTTCADGVEIRLQWDPNPGHVLGYRVYSGPTSATAVEHLDDVPLDGGIDPAAPAVSYDAAADLGLRLGEQACFAVRAYNEQGESSAGPAQCVDL